jgi:hypothetical protein
MPHPFLFLSFPSSSISLSSILSPFRLHSVFLPVPFSPFLSHFAESIPHVLNCLSLLIAHSVPSFLSFHTLPVFPLLVPTSKSRHPFSFFCTLSPQVLRNFLCHNLSYFLLYLDSLILSFLSCLSVSLSLSLSSIFFLLLIFRLIHWHICSSGSTSLSSPCSFSFLSSIPSVSCTLPFHPFCLQTSQLSFPLSLSACSSCTLPSPWTLVFLCPLLALLSNIFLALSLPLPVPSIPISLPCPSLCIMLSPLSLSSQTHPTILFAFFTL